MSNTKVKSNIQIKVGKTYEDGHGNFIKMEKYKPDSYGLLLIGDNGLQYTLMGDCYTSNSGTYPVKGMNLVKETDPVDTSPLDKLSLDDGGKQTSTIDTPEMKQAYSDRTVSFTYTNYKNETSLRTVTPYALPYFSPMAGAIMRQLLLEGGVTAIQHYQSTQQ